MAETSSRSFPGLAMDGVKPSAVQVVIVKQIEKRDKQFHYTNMKAKFAKQLVVLGTLQLVFGLLCIVFQGVNVAVYTKTKLLQFSFVGHGFWSGVLFSVTGIFGIVGGAKKERGKVITFNVMSILSAAVTPLLIGVAIPSALLYKFACNSYTFMPGPRCNDSSNTVDMRTSGLAMESILAILGLSEAVIAIWSSAVSCAIGACCCASSSADSKEPVMTDEQILAEHGIVVSGQGETTTTEEEQQEEPNQQMKIPNQLGMLTLSKRTMFLPNQQPSLESNFEINQQPSFALGHQEPTLETLHQPLPSSYQHQTPSLPQLHHTLTMANHSARMSLPGQHHTLQHHTLRLPQHQPISLSNPHLPTSLNSQSEPMFIPGQQQQQQPLSGLIQLATTFGQNQQESSQQPIFMLSHQHPTLGIHQVPSLSNHHQQQQHPLSGLSQMPATIGANQQGLNHNFMLSQQHHTHGTIREHSLLPNLHQQQQPLSGGIHQGTTLGTIQQEPSHHFMLHHQQPTQGYQTAQSPMTIDQQPMLISNQPQLVTRPHLPEPIVPYLSAQPNAPSFSEQGLNGYSEISAATNGQGYMI